MTRDTELARLRGREVVWREMEEKYADALREIARLRQVKVLHLGPDDRLVVEADGPVDPEHLESVRDGVAEWAGIDPDRVLVLHGANLRMLTPSSQEIPVPESGDES